MTKQTLPNRYKEETAEKPTSAETVKKNVICFKNTEADSDHLCIQPHRIAGA